MNKLDDEKIIVLCDDSGNRYTLCFLGVSPDSELLKGHAGYIKQIEPVKKGVG